MGWEQPIVRFVFQSEELAERAHLTFGFTNTSAPFTISQERVGAEYRVTFQYIGEVVFQPDQQLVVYYNGAPAGWLWILPYMVSGKISWYQEWNPARWQMQNPLANAIIEGGTIPGLPISTINNESGDALQITIDQAYARWAQTSNIDVTFRGLKGNDERFYKSFFDEDVNDVDTSGGDEMVIYFHDRWVDWWNDWNIKEIREVDATLDEIIWGNYTLQMTFEAGSM